MNLILSLFNNIKVPKFITQYVLFQKAMIEVRCLTNNAKRPTKIEMCKLASCALEMGVTIKTAKDGTWRERFYNELNRS